MRAGGSRGVKWDGLVVRAWGSGRPEGIGGSRGVKWDRREVNELRMKCQPAVSRENEVAFLFFKRRGLLHKASELALYFLTCFCFLICQQSCSFCCFVFMPLYSGGGTSSVFQGGGQDGVCFEGGLSSKLPIHRGGCWYLSCMVSAPVFSLEIICCLR